VNGELQNGNVGPGKNEGGEFSIWEGMTQKMTYEIQKKKNLSRGISKTKRVGQRKRTIRGNAVGLLRGNAKSCRGRASNVIVRFAEC